MRTRVGFIIAAAASMFIVHAQQPLPRQESFVERVARMSDPEVIVYVNMRLADALKLDEHDKLGVLINTRPSLLLPLFERRIEDVLRSNDPRSFFTDPTSDSDEFVLLAAARI